MKKMQESIRDLISGYFGENLTEDELQELIIRLESTPSDQKIYEDYRLFMKDSEQEIALMPIDVENALLKTKRQLFVRKNRIFQFLQTAAAVFLLAGLFSSVFIYFYSPGPVAHHYVQKTGLQEVSAVFGTRSKFKLPDGTTVNLNSGSKLIFPIEFSGSFRNVTLVGEAFFDVIPNPDKPFIVKTSEINVKVLGTAFNLQANSGSKEITTTLVHGKVLLERECSGVSTQVAELKPLDRAVFHLAEKVIDIKAEEDLDKFIAWKDGKLVFFNDPLENVSEKLGYWYNVKVKIGNDKLKSVPVYGYIYR